MNEKALKTVYVGLAGIGARFAVPLLLGLIADAAVGLPRWLVLWPIGPWAVFTVLYLVIAASVRPNTKRPVANRRLP